MRGEFDPAIDEGAFFVAAGTDAGGVLGGGFGGEEDFGDGAKGGKEVADGGGAHEGGDAGEVDYARFVGTGGGGGFDFGFCGFGSCEFGRWRGDVIWCVVVHDGGC